MRVCAISVAALLLSTCCVALADEAAKVAEYQKVIEALGSDDEDARGRALGALESGLDQLFEMSMDADEEFEWGPLQDATIAELDRLIPMLESSKSEVGEAVASLIGLVSRKGDKAIPALIRMLQNESAEVGTCMTAALALAQVLPADKPLGPILLPIVKGLKIEEADPPYLVIPKKYGVSLLTLESLGTAAGVYSQMFRGTDRTLIEVPYLVEAASPKYPRQVRLVAIMVLWAFEFDARAAVDPLRKLLRDKDVAVRCMSVQALTYIEDDPELAKARLAESNLTGEEASDLKKAIDDLFDERNEERKSLALALADRGDGEESLLPQMIELAKGRHGFHRRSSIRTLGRIGRGAKPALPVLRDLLKHPDEATRQLAAEAIGKIELDR